MNGREVEHELFTTGPVGRTLQAADMTSKRSFDPIKFSKFTTVCSVTRRRVVQASYSDSEAGEPVHERKPPTSTGSMHEGEHTTDSIVRRKAIGLLCFPLVFPLSVTTGHATSLSPSA